MNDDPDSTSLQLEIAVLDPLWHELVTGLPRGGEPGNAAARNLVAAAVAAAFRGAAPGTLRHVPCEISLVLGDDARVRELNRDYRGVDKATNVLSFAALDDLSGAPGFAPGDEETGEIVLGDVILARETVVREASEQGKDVTDHIGHLVVHGVLHLLGFDHETDPDAVEMESLEADILAGLGIANPYHAGEAGLAAGTPEGIASSQ